VNRRDLITGLLLSLATPALAVVKQISILHSGFPDRTPIHVLIEALRVLGYENGNTTPHGALMPASRMTFPISRFRS
jgi:hypothetical protein